MEKVNFMIRISFTIDRRKVWGIYYSPQKNYLKITLEDLKDYLDMKYTLQDFINGKVVLEIPNEKDHLLNSF